MTELMAAFSAPGLSEREWYALLLPPALCRSWSPLTLYTLAEAGPDSWSVRKRVLLASKARSEGRGSSAALRAVGLTGKAVGTVKVATPASSPTVPSVEFRTRTVDVVLSMKYTAPVAGLTASAVGTMGADSQARPSPSVMRVGATPHPASTCSVPWLGEKRRITRRAGSERRMVPSGAEARARTTARGTVRAGAAATGKEG
jgi:hypothetical protein